MPKFTATVKGEDARGRRYDDKVTVTGNDQESARRAVENMLLDGEEILCVDPGSNGDEIPPARG